jgi:hypothetical protein
VWRFVRSGGWSMLRMMGGGPDDMAGHEHHHAHAADGHQHDHHNHEHEG